MTNIDGMGELNKVMKDIVGMNFSIGDDGYIVFDNGIRINSNLFCDKCIVEFKRITTNFCSIHKWGYNKWYMGMVRVLSE